MEGMVGGDWIGLDGRVLHVFFECGLAVEHRQYRRPLGNQMETEANREDGDRG